MIFTNFKLFITDLQAITPKTIKLTNLSFKWETLLTVQGKYSQNVTLKVLSGLCRARF